MNDFGKLLQKLFSPRTAANVANYFRFESNKFKPTDRRFDLHSLQLIPIPGFPSRLHGSMKRESRAAEKFHRFN